MFIVTVFKRDQARQGRHQGPLSCADQLAPGDAVAHTRAPENAADLLKPNDRYRIRGKGERGFAVSQPMSPGV